MKVEKVDECNNIRNDYNTFQRMKELQTLIKKESALKELCKNTIYLFFNY
jgi:hypothetical protein